MELVIGRIKLPCDVRVAMTVQVQVSLQYDRTTVRTVLLL
jgi:hypothetical protein